MLKTCTILLVFVLSLGTAYAVDWEILPTTLPAPRADMASTAIEDTLYLIGGSVPGSSAPVATASVLAWNMQTNSFQQAPPSMSVPRIGADAVTYDGWVVVFGGRRDEENYVSEIEAWRPGMDSWIVVNYLTPARSGLRAIVDEDHILVTGGTSGPLQLHNRMDKIIPHLGGLDPTVNVVALADTLPTPRSHHGLSKIGDSIYMFGGFSLWPLSDCYRLDQDGWVQVYNMVLGVGNMSVAPYKIQQTEVLVSAGGRTVEGETDAIQYLLASGEWFDAGDITPLPYARAGHVLASLRPEDNRTLFVFGGYWENALGQSVLIDQILRLTQGSTSYVQHDHSLPPSSIQLQAHPNPSNGAVTITIVPSSGTSPLDVRIFDLLGREVTRWNLPPSRGSSTISWSGALGGRDVAGGIYFLVARSGGQQQVLKLFRMP